MTDKLTKTKPQSPKAKVLPQAQQNNVFIPPDLAQAIIVFLGRTQIQGQEAEAMVAAKATLQRIVTTQQPENIT